MPIRVPAAVVLCLGAVGCGTPATPGPGSPSAPQGTTARAVLAKLQELSDEGRRRYGGETHTHAEVAGWYLGQMRGIESGGLPQRFAEKFQAYERAWVALQERSRSAGQEVRGITHYTILFDQLKDELKPTEWVSNRGDDPLLNAILIQARELAYAAAGRP